MYEICDIFKIDNRIHGRSGWKERFLVFCASINLSKSYVLLAATVKCHIIYIYVFFFFLFIYWYYPNAARTLVFTFRELIQITELYILERALCVCIMCECVWRGGG